MQRMDNTFIPWVFAETMSVSMNECVVDAENGQSEGFLTDSLIIILCGAVLLCCVCCGCLVWWRCNKSETKKIKQVMTLSYLPHIGQRQASFQSISPKNCDPVADEEEVDVEVEVID